MPRHLVTTATLMQDIARQRAEEASARWAELSREFMEFDPPEGSQENG